MRLTSREITVTESIQRNIVAQREEIMEISESKASRRVEVIVHAMSSEGDVLLIESVQIESDDYNLLVSESPSFAPGKPAMEYREADLWFIIDSIRNRQ